MKESPLPTPEEPTSSTKKRRSSSSTGNAGSRRCETNGFIHFLIALIQMLNTIFSNFHNIVWGIILLLALKTIFVQGAVIADSDIQLGKPQLNISTLFAGRNSNSSFILYPTSSLEAKTFQFHLGEIQHEVFFGMSTMCNSIQLWNNLCKEDQSNCQLARINIDNAESTMKIHIKTLFTVSRICELPTYPSSGEAIYRCHKGMPWSTREDAT